MTTTLRNGILRVAAQLAPDALSDGELLARYLADGDDSAFAVVVRRHANMVFGTCRRILGNAADADDAFQAVFVVLIRRASSFTDRACVGNFLYGVACHAALKAKAMAAKRRLREANAEPPLDSNHDSELLKILDEELAKLPEKYREPVVLCELEGIGRKETAARLNIAEGTISSRLATAHRMLEKRLKARGFAGVMLGAVLANPTASATPALVSAAVQTATLGPSAGVATLVTEVLKMMFLSKLKLNGIILVAVCGLVLSGVMIAVPGGPGIVQGEDKPAAKEELPTAEALVKQLGDPVFKDREAAEKSLRAIGKKAIPALQAGLKSEFPEVVQRSERLVGQIHKDALDQFLSQKEGSDSRVWKRFKAITGDSNESRKLYVEMMADSTKADLLERVDHDDTKCFESYKSEMTRLEKEWFAAFQEFEGKPIPEDGYNPDVRKRSLEVVKRADVLNVFFLGTRPLPLKTNDIELTRTVVDQANFIELAKGPEREPFIKLYLAWLKQREKPKELEAGLNAALYASIPEAATFARELIAKPKQTPEILAQAMLILGNHGELTDLLLLAKFRADERTYSPYSKPYQLRELATAMSLLLRKEDFTNYGFEEVNLMAWWVGNKPAPYLQIEHFKTAEERDAALEKAGKWLDEQPKVPVEKSKAK